MGLDFLANYGARRTGRYGEPPQLIGTGAQADPSEETVEEGEEERVDADYEMPAANWRPKDTGQAEYRRDWPLRPVRFVDGKQVGRTVAWLRSREGWPVPVRLAEIGAVVLRDVGGELRREFSIVERVVAMMGDLFPWEEVEGFAIALQEQGFRLLNCRPPGADENPFDFGRLRDTASERAIDEMFSLEKLAMRRETSVPTLVDGALEAKMGAFAHTDPVVGFIKTHYRSNYLHPQGWRVFYDLDAGERTPAFLIRRRDEDRPSDLSTALPKRRLDVVTWYLRLCVEDGDSPERGIVRLEIPQRFFTETLGGDWDYLDRLSRLVCKYRSRDEGYARSPMTIIPIQRAEESLGALFTQSDTLISRFYRLTGL